jgi:hypothetical protein
MLRHPSLAVALFLTASCELAGAPPPPASPANPVASTPAPALEAGVSSTATATKPSREEALLELTDTGAADVRPPVMMRGGPSWGKERPRFKARVAAPAAPAATTSDKPAPPKASTP